jgi:sugar lactone lactonase YvrE
MTDVNEPFNLPALAARDQQGNLYVLEEGSSQIRKYDKAGNLITRWGSHGPRDDQFNFGYGGDIAIDSNGAIFVSDGGNHKVKKFDLNGKFLSVWGGFGTGDGEFLRPRGIAVDRHGNVYVANGKRDPSGNSVMPGYNEIVQVFDGNGKFLAKWGITGAALGELDVPNDIEIDGADNIYVSSQYSCWIHKFDTRGKLLDGWNACDLGSTKLKMPTGVMAPTGLALDRQGNLYVSNLPFCLICKFTAGGEFLGAWGTHSVGEGEFSTMGDLTVTEDGTIYVPDIEKNQILVFKQK